MLSLGFTARRINSAFAHRSRHGSPSSNASKSSSTQAPRVTHVNSKFEQWLRHFRNNEMGIVGRLKDGGRYRILPMLPGPIDTEPDRYPSNDRLLDERRMTIELKTISLHWHTRYRNGAALLSRCAAGLAMGTLLALSACAGSALPDDPFAGQGSAMAMVPINHTDRYATNIFVEKYWAGDVDDHAGGGKAACCYPGLKNWRQPVTVTWTWGQESDPQTKVVQKKREQRTVTAYFPASGPHSDRDPVKDDAYVCVILRDLDKAELAFSPTASGCADK